MLKVGGMGKGNIGLRQTFGSGVKQTQLILLRSKLFLLTLAPHPIQS